jgi:hypothetical protein
LDNHHKRPRHVPGAGAGRRSVDNQLWIDDANLRFEPGSFNVLLGRTWPARPA